jgi:hypothetical protein
MRLAAHEIGHVLDRAEAHGLIERVAGLGGQKVGEAGAAGDAVGHDPAGDRPSVAPPAVGRRSGDVEDPGDAFREHPETDGRHVAVVLAGQVRDHPGDGEDLGRAERGHDFRRRLETGRQARRVVELVGEAGDHDAIGGRLAGRGKVLARHRAVQHQRLGGPGGQAVPGGQPLELGSRLAAELNGPGHGQPGHAGRRAADLGQVGMVGIGEHPVERGQREA